MSRKQEILEYLKKVLNDVLPIEKKVFIFGSQVGKEQWGNADIDIGIDTGKKIELKKMLKIATLIDTIPTLYTFDIVDFNGVSKEFKNIALKKAEFLF